MKRLIAIGIAALVVSTAVTPRCPADSPVNSGKGVARDPLNPTAGAPEAKPTATATTEAKPAAATTEAAKPAAAKPDAAKPDAAKPDVAKPDVALPPPLGTKASATTTAKATPGPGDSNTGKPEAGKPAATKPATTKSETSKPAGEATKPATEPAKAGLVSKKPVWLTNLAEAQAAARKSNRPLLVKFDASFCVWCKKLDEVFDGLPATKLAPLVLLKLDAGRDTDEAERWSVAGTPAMRIVSPSGRLLASQDGYLPADELTAWLAKGLAEAAAVPEADLTSSEPPGALEAVRIVRVFKVRDVALREAALERLRPFPRESAPATAAALRDGNLQSRLAALDLLRSWRAPADGLDPWQPETVTTERLAALDAWVRTTVDGANLKPWEPTAQELAAAVRELDTLASAGEADAAALQARLAKFGAHLLPSVTARLRASDDEQFRERLSALRYRLVAAPSRVLDWPGGIERLASRDVEERRRAVDELVRRAQSYDQALLLELFGDPDPLVRELSLRGLQTAAGDKAGAALVKLLADPEPNVRAAVLKQWAEKPPLGLLAELKNYVATERDADLLVHAVRVLREIKSETQPVLIGLMKHEAWQVRAEAAEALAAGAKEYRYGSGNEEKKAEAYAAFVELLNDSDGFVASRAVEGLRGADLPAALKPLLKLAETRPELAPVVIDVVVESDGLRKAAIEQLRKFAAHAEPSVRAAAIKGLSHDATVDCDKELLAALADTDGRVRIAAAEGIWNRGRNQVAAVEIELPHVVVVEEQPGLIAGALRSIFGGVEPAPPPAAAVPVPQPKKPDPPKEVKKPDPPTAPLLRKMLDSKDQAEVVAAAKALAGAGLAAEVFPRLEALARGNPDLIYELSQVLPTLDWDRRARLFGAFVDVQPNKAADAAYYLVQNADERAIEVMWNLCRDPRLTREQSFGLLDSLRRAYLGNSYYDPSQAPIAARKRMLAEATERLRRGIPAERGVALALFATAVPDERLAAAADVLAAEFPLDAELRELALRIVLLAGGKAEADGAALWALGQNDPALATPALALLARDYRRIMYWDGHGYFLSNLRDHVPHQQRDDNASASNPFDPTVPEGLTTDLLHRAARSDDPFAKAYSRYFGILLNETEDLGPLLTAWEAEPGDPTFRRLLVRAIAYLDDPGNLPLLELIYASVKESTSEAGDFYWTIRIMHGPEVLSFRKRIRDELGIDQLR